MLQFAAFVDKGVDLIISADSMPQHVGAAYDKNIIVVNTYKWKTHPFNDKNKVFYGEKDDVVKLWIDEVLNGNNFEQEIIGEPIKTTSKIGVCMSNMPKVSGFNPFNLNSMIIPQINKNTIVQKKKLLSALSSNFLNRK